MTATIATRDAIVQLRRLSGVKLGTLSDGTLGRLITHVGGDVDLAATALMMTPRPEWVSRLLGDAPR